jgi:hypothetical protein
MTDISEMLSSLSIEFRRLTDDRDRINRQKISLDHEEKDNANKLNNILTQIVPNVEKAATESKSIAFSHANFPAASAAHGGLFGDVSSILKKDDDTTADSKYTMTDTKDAAHLDFTKWPVNRTAENGNKVTYYTKSSNLYCFKIINRKRTAVPIYTGPKGGMRTFLTPLTDDKQDHPISTARQIVM